MNLKKKVSTGAGLIVIGVAVFFFAVVVILSEGAVNASAAVII